MEGREGEGSLFAPTCFFLLFTSGLTAARLFPQPLCLLLFLYGPNHLSLGTLRSDRCADSCLHLTLLPHLVPVLQPGGPTAGTTQRGTYTSPDALALRRFHFCSVCFFPRMTTSWEQEQHRMFISIMLGLNEQWMEFTWFIHSWMELRIHEQVNSEEETQGSSNRSLQTDKTPQHSPGLYSQVNALSIPTWAWVSSSLLVLSPTKFKCIPKSGAPSASGVSTSSLGLFQRRSSLETSQPQHPY